MTLITADQQTTGRGRLNKKWESPEGLNIYATFCFFRDIEQKNIGNIPQVLALSAIKILKKLGFSPTLKWPNDILLSEKKLGGILTETIPELDERLILAGIGLNINMSLDALNQIQIPATSLFIERGRTFDIETLINLLSRQFSSDIELFWLKGFNPFIDLYRSLMPKANKKIKFHHNKEIIEGEFHSINDEGSLKLILDNGEIKTFVSGEIIYSS